MHRVQRVPETESQGRIHTSTMTVAVLPEAEDVDVHIEPKDIKIDVMRSTGPGGQSVNTTDSAVRVTHLPTGIVVACQDERSQIQNRERALKILRARLYERALEERNAAEAAERLSQIGTGERSEKIRTYNYPERRVTDHRIKLTSHNLDAVLAGDLSAFTQALAGRGPQAPPRGREPQVSTVRELLGRSREYLERNGVPSPKLDAEYLLAHVLAVPRLELYLDHDRPLEPAEVDSLRELVRRRGQREPLAYVLGSWSFYGLELHCDARALVPRPETEVLVERCLALLGGRRRAERRRRRHRHGRDRARARGAPAGGERDGHRPLARRARAGRRERRRSTASPTGWSCWRATCSRRSPAVASTSSPRTRRTSPQGETVDPEVAGFEPALAVYAEHGGTGHPRAPRRSRAERAAPGRPPRRRGRRGPGAVARRAPRRPRLRGDRRHARPARDRARGRGASPVLTGVARQMTLAASVTWPYRTRDDHSARGYPDQVPLRLDLAEPRVDLAPLSAALAEGACAVIPTDTVYGLVCDAGSARGVRAAERAQGTRPAPALDGHVRDASRPPRRCSRRSSRRSRGARGRCSGAGRPCSCPTRSAATCTSAATIRSASGCGSRRSRTRSRA